MSSSVSTAVASKANEGLAGTAGSIIVPRLRHNVKIAVTTRIIRMLLGRWRIGVECISALLVGAAVVGECTANIQAAQLGTKGSLSIAIMSSVRMSKTFTERSAEMLASKDASALTASPAKVALHKFHAHKPHHRVIASPAV